MTKKFHYAWLIVISVCLMNLVGGGLIFGAAGVFFGPVTAELGIGVGQLAFYLTVTNLVTMVTLPIAGKIFAKFKTHVLMTIAFIVQLGAYASFSLAQSVVHFYISALFIGLTGGFIIYLITPNLVNNWFAVKRGTIMGIALSFTGVGGVVFAPIGTMLIQNIGWRGAYVILAIIGAVLILPITIFIVRRTPAEKGLQPYGAEQTTDEPSNGTSPMDGVPAKVAIKSAPFIFLLIMIVFTNIAATGISHIPGIAISLGLAATAAAAASSSYSIGLICGKIIFGVLADKIGLQKTMLINALVGILGIVTMLLIQQPFTIMAGSFCIGFAASAGTVATPLFTRTAFGMRDYSEIYSKITPVGALTSAVFNSGHGFIYDITGSYKPVLSLIAIALAASVMLSWMVIDRSKKRKIVSSNAN